MHAYCIYKHNIAKKGLPHNDNNPLTVRQQDVHPLSWIASTTIPTSLLPALLVIVIVLGAAAGGGPLGTFVLLSLFQELIQPEGILLKGHRPLPSLAWVSS